MWLQCEPDCGSEEMKRSQTHGKAGMSGLGSGREKPQEHGSLACLLYTVQYRVGLLHTTEQGGRVIFILFF